VVIGTSAIAAGYGLNRTYTDETYSRGTAKISLALIGLSGLLRLPLKMLVGLIAAVTLSILILSANYFEANPRLWAQGQINITCSVVLALLIYTANLRNERSTFDAKRKLDQQLELADNANIQKSKFLAALSHDLRQPLTGFGRRSRLGSTTSHKRSRP
jgi:signal transduction histidine kinase